MSAFVTMVTVIAALAQAPTVSFDLSAVPETEYRQYRGLELERKVSLRLVQEGFSVVAPQSGGAQIQIRVRSVPRQGWLLDASNSSRKLSARVDPTEGTRAELHLEVSQKVSELTRALAVGLKPPVAPVPETPAAAPVEAPVVATAAPRNWELRASGGVSLRGSGVDPHLALSLRHAFGAVGGELEGALSFASAQGIRVLEPQAALVIGVRWDLPGPFYVEPGAGAGLLLHVYSLEDTFFSQGSGVVLSPIVSARLRAGWRVTERLAVEARGSLGVVRPIRHESEGLMVWSREGVHGEVTAGFSWTM